tara:strand:+ start:383 stop:1330 length:948 start_codon:yes stop_codon:yes gene_type:complete
MKNLEKIKGDASFRKFFRKKKSFFTSIIVFSKKDKIKNLLVYDAVNKILIKNKILAPKLYNENYYKNYLEIQDFGNDTVLKVLKKKKNKKIFYYKKIVKLLNKMQLIKDKSIKNFKNKNFKIPRYDNKVLISEAFLFCDWYVKKNLKTRNKIKFVKEFKKIIKKLALSLKLKNNVFVHRDFHVSNLMKVDNQIGVIDSQDAMIGNRAYDLASLIDDVRLETSLKLKKKIYKLYINKQRKLDKNKFKNDFEILSILRNLKIIGIFTRLAFRDGKKKYLRLIPHAWKLIEVRINQNKLFLDLKQLLNTNFKGKLNEN